MSEFIDALVSLMGFLGAWLGLFLAASIAWAASSLIWGEFNTGLFVGISIPCLIAGAYLQHVVEKDS